MLGAARSRRRSWLDRQGIAWRSSASRYTSTAARIRIKHLAAGALHRQPERAVAEMVEQPDRARRAAVLEHDRAARPVRVRRSGAMDQQRLVDPRAGVRDPRQAARPAPAVAVVAAERPAPV